MSAVAYFIFGLGLVILLGLIIALYYSARRKDEIEEPKHKMLEDDD